jgi:D-glycero-alpha-D-manno-heptose 1-phosphate guanylyltransferase
VTESAVILAGGLGTRLQKVLREMPKSLAPVNGQPFLSYLFRYLAHYRIRNIFLSVGFQSDKIMTEYGSSFLGMGITYVSEDSPLGTGGGLRKALSECDEDRVLALNGDSFFDVDLRSFAGLHAQSGASMSLALRRVENAGRYGAIKVDEAHTVTAFDEKSGSEAPGLINGGTYLINRDWFLSETPPEANFSLEKDLLGKKAGDQLLKGFEFKGYFIDIGVPDDYERAQDELKGFKY